MKPEKCMGHWVIKKYKIIKKMIVRNLEHEIVNFLLPFCLKFVKGNLKGI